MKNATMIERVAAAIMRANFSREIEVQGINVSVPDNMDLARAAIEAMREPTSAMERAGDSKSYKLYNPSTDPVYMNGAPDIVWEAMIDAALAGKE